MKTLYAKFDSLFSRIPEALVLLFVRIVAAQPFWSSGRSKMDGLFEMRPIVIDLFRNEYGMPWPEFTAPLTAAAEHVLPILLVVGLFTRFAALGLLVMTAVIQIFVYPDAWWTVHSLWAALLLVLLARGGGQIALDHALLGKAKG